MRYYDSGRRDHNARRRTIPQVTHMVSYIDRRGNRQNHINYSIEAAREFAVKLPSFSCTSIVLFEYVSGNWVECKEGD